MQSFEVFEFNTQNNWKSLT